MSWIKKEGGEREEKKTETKEERGGRGRRGERRVGRDRERDRERETEREMFFGLFSLPMPAREGSHVRGGRQEGSEHCQLFHFSSSKIRRETVSSLLT